MQFMWLYKERSCGYLPPNTSLNRTVGLLRKQTKSCETPNQIVKYQNRKPQCKRSRGYIKMFIWLYDRALCIEMDVHMVIKILSSSCGYIKMYVHVVI